MVSLNKCGNGLYKSYRHADLDKALTAKRIKNEVKLLAKAESLGIAVPKVYHVDHGTGSIVMQFIEGSQSVCEYIKKLQASEEKEEVVNAKLAKIASEMGRVIGLLHRSEVVHGDLTTSNVLIKNEQASTLDEFKPDIVFIDFGLSSVTSSLEDKAVDLYVLERALISTHSLKATLILEKILHAYSTEYGRNVDKVIERFEQVRLRGRKRTMIG